MYWDEDEAVVFCPYNRYHIVSKLKIQKHILKCRKNYPDVELVTCFYNFTHKLKPEDVLKHYEVCAQKTRIEGARYDEENQDTADPSVLNNFHTFNFPTKAAQIHNNCNDSCHFSIKSLNRKMGYKDVHEEPETESESEDCPSEINFERSTDHETSSDEGNSKHSFLPGSDSSTLRKQQCVADSDESRSSKQKGFGRAKNIFNYGPSKPPRKTDHLLPDVSDMDTILPKKNNVSKFFTRSVDTSCSASLVSSAFDDSTSLASQSIIFDDDFDFNFDKKEENIDQDGNVFAVENNGFIFKNFDKYVKI